ncbi:unnamed protein product [Nippostrongylus brasiliensis]|uniref:Let-653 protein (inferred by orthology to a C. elegans protein) n=1 Tax=Nippostrongylus brasiliensis TaxID=27835 RepID=A0A158QZE6_NIPBR|nr:unnamed protein product [Nippostrongylus brasiliensis]
MSLGGLQRKLVGGMRYLLVSLLLIPISSVRLNFKSVASARLSLRACESACSLGEDPQTPGRSLECAALNHHPSPDGFAHHCDIFQPHQLQNVDGYVEADDRYSFYWKYCLNKHLADRYRSIGPTADATYQLIVNSLNRKRFTSTTIQISESTTTRITVIIVKSKFPYSGALYGLYDFFTCRIEPKGENEFEYLFPSPTTSRNCSDSIRFQGDEMVLDVVLSTDGIEPLYFITPDDLTYQAKCPLIDTKYNGGNGIEEEHQLQIIRAHLEKRADDDEDLLHDSGQFLNENGDFFQAQQDPENLEVVKSQFQAPIVDFFATLSSSSADQPLTISVNKTTIPTPIKTTTTVPETTTATTPGNGCYFSGKNPHDLCLSPHLCHQLLPVLHQQQQLLVGQLQEPQQRLQQHLDRRQGDQQQRRLHRRQPLLGQELLLRRPLLPLRSRQRTSSNPTKPAKGAVSFDIFHNGQPVEAVVVGTKITLSFAPLYAIPQGCQADLVGLVCPPTQSEFGVKVAVESFRYQSTPHVQYSCLVRICPFAPCPTASCPPVEGCSTGKRVARGLSLEEIRRALEADPKLASQIGLPPHAFTSRPGNNVLVEQQLRALAGDHTVKRRLVVVNSEDQLRYYVRTGDIP